MPLTKPDNSAMTRDEVRSVQRELAKDGFDPGPVDGIMGPHTESAIIAFKRSHGLKPRAWVGPLTWKMLHEPPLVDEMANDLPW